MGYFLTFSGAAGSRERSNARSTSHKCLFVFFVRPYGYRMPVRNAVIVRDICTGWLADDAYACAFGCGHREGGLDSTSGSVGGVAVALLRSAAADATKATST